MTLVDDAAAAGQRAVDGHLGDWLDRGLHGALDLVEAQQAALPAAGSPSGADTTAAVRLERAALEQATAGLDGVASLRPQLLVLGSDLTARVLGQVAVGRPERARAAASASTMTFAQRRSAKAAATEAERAATEARKAATEATIQKAETIGLAALKAALPFLLAAIA